MSNLFTEKREKELFMINGLMLLRFGFNHNPKKVTPSDRQPILAIEKIFSAYSHYHLI